MKKSRASKKTPETPEQNTQAVTPAVGLAEIESRLADMQLKSDIFAGQARSLLGQAERMQDAVRDLRKLLRGEEE